MRIFDNLYAKVQEKNKKSDVDIYLEFISNMRDYFNLKVDNIQSYWNVWHIKQNELKNKYNGRQTARQLCENKYWEAFNNLEKYK